MLIVDPALGNCRLITTIRMSQKCFQPDNRSWGYFNAGSYRIICPSFKIAHQYWMADKKAIKDKFKLCSDWQTPWCQCVQQTMSEGGFIVYLFKSKNDTSYTKLFHFVVRTWRGARASSPIHIWMSVPHALLEALPTCLIIMTVSPVSYNCKVCSQPVIWRTQYRPRCLPPPGLPSCCSLMLYREAPI